MKGQASEGGLPWEAWMWLFEKPRGRVHFRGWSAKQLYGPMAWYYREMSVKIPYCMICGRVGVDLGRIAGKDVALCPDCAEALMPKISALVEAAGRRPARAAERITPEQFRERVAASVERRGQLNVLEVARRLGFPAPKAREIAEALAQERGWQTEKGRRKLILRKPAAAPAQG